MQKPRLRISGETPGGYSWTQAGQKAVQVDRSTSFFSRQSSRTPTLLSSHCVREEEETTWQEEGREDFKEVEVEVEVLDEVDSEEEGEERREEVETESILEDEGGGEAAIGLDSEVEVHLGAD